jgi:2-amino-4-hydroxy-6-hydroxymethyldihydropteridine diphosphokinase
MAMTRCYVALGANLGDPVATVLMAISALSELSGCELIAESSLYRTAPVGLKHQPDFINAVVAIDTVLPAPTLMRLLFRIEEKFGRQRAPTGVRNLARTLDLDLLLFGDQISAEPALTLPHPRMHERAFVLAPLAEITTDLVVPGQGGVSELLALCGGQRIERLPSM